MVAQPKEKRRPGVQARPSLDQERQDTLLNAVRMGNPLKTSCLFAGIDDSTLRKWRKRGETAQAVRPAARTPVERKFADFVTALDKALAEANVRAQLTVHKIMTTDVDTASVEEKRLALQAAQFHLTHRDPANYSTQVRTEVTGRDGAPLEVIASGMDVYEMLAKIEAADPDPDDG